MAIEHPLIGKYVSITTRHVVGRCAEVIKYFGKVTAVEGNLLQITNCEITEKIVDGSTVSTTKEGVGTRWFNTYASGFLYMDEC